MRRPALGHGAVGVAVLAALMLVGCGASGSNRHPASGSINHADAAQAFRLSPDLVPLRAGRSAAYRLPADSAAVRAQRAIGGLSCRRRPGSGYGVHLELYARRLVVPVPAGIGFTPPLERSGAYVRGGACAYPVRTYEPTGLVVIDRRSLSRRSPERLAEPHLADLFAVWGQPLSRRSLAGFRGTVRAFLDGRPWSSQPGGIPLRPHAEIVLEVGAFVAPHPRYTFPPGL